MKVETDSQHEVDVNKLVKKEDLNPMAQKMDTIIRKAEKILKKQNSEFEREDESYNLQQYYSQALVYFTIFQIIIVLLISIYHLYSFRTFLITNKVINKST